MQELLLRVSYIKFGIYQSFFTPTAANFIFDLYSFTVLVNHQGKKTQKSPNPENPSHWQPPTLPPELSTTTTSHPPSVTPSG